MSALQHRVEQFLYHNAELCDRREWDDYIATFTEDSELHVPQWDSEYEVTSDPKTGLSLMYYPNRSGLEDRVFRIRTGKSAASVPLPRTQHQVHNVRIKEQENGDLAVTANWQTVYTRMGMTEQFYGEVNYRLVSAGDSFKIARKHVVVYNDTINSVLDFYHL
ncbi:anthranilate 1,2-dioxygenase small subunit [Oceanobacter mangrovi]|uniref:anthranilate 1,2-dioxygenase small subunit n=1 Tax=Oceanobacter mangrovi TaxID=2862510 RepID=UPI001C8D5F0E|nr:anthranilate 1,2-dioxygenase small subunit [Oceanobacter mangrovi]